MAFADAERVPEHRVVSQVGYEFRKLHRRMGYRMLGSDAQSERQTGAHLSEFSQVGGGIPAAAAFGNPAQQRYGIGFLKYVQPDALRAVPDR